MSMLDPEGLMFGLGNGPQVRLTQKQIDLMRKQIKALAKGFREMFEKQAHDSQVSLGRVME